MSFTRDVSVSTPDERADAFVAEIQRLGLVAQYGGGRIDWRARWVPRPNDCERFCIDTRVRIRLEASQVRGFVEELQRLELLQKFGGSEIKWGDCLVVPAAEDGGNHHG